MTKPEGYDTAQVQGEREKPAVGGHHLTIMAVKEQESKTGKPMIIVYFDFAKNDRQPDLFSKQFKADTRENKKWPRRGTQYIVVTGNDGNTTSSYKTFCTCFEKSNNTKIDWCEDSAKWDAQFKGKKIGGAFGLVHSLWDSPTEGLKEMVNPELRWFVTDDKVDPDSVPNEKMLSSEDQQKYNASVAPAGGIDGFMNVPDAINEELPF